MAQPVETTTILNAQPFWMLEITLYVQAGEHQQTDKQNGRTDRRYQTYYLPCFAVDNNKLFVTLVCRKTWNKPLNSIQ